MGKDVDIKAIEQKVLEIISEQMGVDKVELARNLSFINDLNSDSLDTVELVMEFEDEFGMSIPDEEAEQIQTIGEAIDYIVNAARAAKSPYSYLSQINEIAKYFVNEPTLYRLEDIMKKNNLLPQEKGIYGWYFDELPPKIPAADYFTIEDYKLLYIGIAGEYENSKSNLKKRIWEKHLNGDATISTLRKSLGTLLRDKLVIQPYKKDNDFWFGTLGEGRLSEWMIMHARVAWITNERSWEIEELIFSLYGKCLPLNIQNNKNNPFTSKLKEMREVCKKEAKD